MTLDQGVTVKGSAVRSLNKFIESDLSAEQRRRALGALPAEMASRLTAAQANESIPVHLLNRLTEEAASAKEEPLDAFARRAGRDAAEEAVKGIYRYFALVLTPPALLSKASQMWSAIYDRGQLRVEQQSDRGACIRLIDFPSEAAGCGRMAGWIERMAELTGATEITLEHDPCAARGGPYCEWAVRWK
ncbi:MAG: hypothetical protein JWN02_2600 [Acidobacteria bacterium]|nr:hypothetical protein [Acidobacteriota bacterium]